MAYRNIFEALNATPDGGAPKNPYDLHAYDWLTSKAGQFLPVACRETVPDAIYRMSVDNYTVTFPCNTASQADMKENYYFVFIPYYLLTRSAYSFFVNRQDNQSALPYNSEQIPWFPLGDVVAECVRLAVMYQKGYRGDDAIKDIHGYSIHVGALRLLDLLGYGCYLDCVQKAADLWGDAPGVPTPAAVTAFIDALRTNLNQYKPNILRIAAYQKTWYCYFRNSMYDNDISPRCFNFDDVTYPTDTSYNVLDYRSLTQFITECLQLRYVQNKKDIVSASMPGTQYGAVSSIPLSDDLVGVSTTPDVLRSDIARWKGSSFGGLNYPNGSGDYSKSNELRGVNDGSNSRGNVVITNPPGLSSYDTQFQVRTTHDHPDGVATFASGTTLFDVLALTEAQAIQKWRQKSMMAGQRLKDQYRAHYGSVPNHMQDDYPDFIGSVDNMIQISQVVSQANTLASDDKSNLGDLAGRGYGASDHKVFTFHAKEQGVVILFRSVVAENVYASYGIDRANQLIYYTDFYQSELQNIGLEAVPKIILRGFAPTTMDVDPTGDGGDSPLPTNSSVIGYAPRNYQLKQYLSKVHGHFNPSRFADPITSGGASGNVPHFGFGQLEAFVQVRRDVIQTLSYSDGSLSAGSLPITLSQLYCNPAVTNSTFSFDADSFEDTDTFIHKVRFNCDAVQPLSVLGLPQF